MRKKALVLCGCAFLSATLFVTQAAPAFAGSRPYYGCATEAQAERINSDEAKKIALEHAGVKASEATFVTVELERGGCRSVYEVEFRANNVDYEYEIDAITGAVVSIDNGRHRNHRRQHHSRRNAQHISAGQAREIALQHAGISYSDVGRMKVKREWTDLGMQYEVKFYFNNTAYEYEIDATTGKILDFEQNKR
ncbi:MAG TPA: PepSY domain-containing protein [Candidatus Avacidaminococcus intestinavium]|uniref:PepSY domain-containing protein n=1 Tax=Candidatus Avacidaminococcus intestinavium TaxID=2840684 RepID=A0A9D1MPX3_9FIRM|nr:PepSY domain-containing protein [Candidatus Avacidaminococcus intestinavium]